MTVDVVTGNDGFLLESLFEISAIPEHGNKNGRMRPGVLDSGLSSFDMPAEAHQSAGQANQVEAKFDDLMAPYMKARNQKKEGHTKQSEEEHKENQPRVVLMRPMVLAAAVFVAVMVDHLIKLKYRRTAATNRAIEPMLSQSG